MIKKTATHWLGTGKGIGVFTGIGYVTYFPW